MSKRPSISHSAITNLSGSKGANKGNSDRSSLVELYPKPKTYGQRAQDDKMRQQAYRRHWPRYPYLNIAAYGSALLGLVIWFAQNLNTWWFSAASYGDVMSHVFFSFVVGLMLVFLIVFWVSYVNKLFSYFRGAIQIFWFIYPLEVGTLLTLWLSGLMWDYMNISWIPVLAIFHFVIVFFSVQPMIGTGETEH
ncbi:MAG TPA: hypothetical protein VLG36_00665 [Candidatus Chromulinivoraceae bacterium]|nr:hypothetical protein [Candidatus Chromulinivoraceae bacterium]